MRSESRSASTSPTPAFASWAWPKSSSSPVAASLVEHHPLADDHDARSPARARAGPSRRAHTASTDGGCSGMRIACAPPASPDSRAIQPAWRPITSTTITRSCDSAVVWRRSIASVAICTAVQKPNVKSVPERSLSIVFGTPDDVQPVLGVQPARHAERVLAADRDERVEAEVGEGADALLAAALRLEGVGAGAAEDRAAAREDRARRRRGSSGRRVALAAGPASRRSRPTCSWPVPAAGAHHGPDHGVQAGAVTPAGEDADAHPAETIRGGRRPARPSRPLDERRWPRAPSSGAGRRADRRGRPRTPSGRRRAGAGRAAARPLRATTSGEHRGRRRRPRACRRAPPGRRARLPLGSSPGGHEHGHRQRPSTPRPPGRRRPPRWGGASRGRSRRCRRPPRRRSRRAAAIQRSAGRHHDHRAPSRATSPRWCARSGTRPGSVAQPVDEVGPVERLLHRPGW